MPSTTPLRALIYTRVSEDRAAGRSPREQEAECRQVCADNGWEVAEVVTDTKGASRHSKGTRPGWARVLDRLATGEVDVLVAWEASRTGRTLDAYLALRTLAVEHKVTLAYGDEIWDMAKSKDRKASAQAAVDSEAEADKISDRVRRAMRASAAEGRPPGRRLYGYARTYCPDTGRLEGQEAHPEESAVVRDIFAGYLGGRGIRTLARDLNARGITTGTGAAWTDVQVRRALANPAYAARRVHRGEVVGAAAWPALVEPDTFDRVQVRIAAARGGPRTVGTARLLTGVGRCGKCGGRLHALHDRNRRKLYECRDGYCVARDLLALDAYVGAVVVARLSRPDVTEALGGVEADPAVEAARQEGQALQAQVDEALEEFTAGRLSAALLARVEASVLPRIQAAEQAARKALVPLEVDVPEQDVAGWWEALEPDVRRSLVGVLLAAVVLLPTKKGSRTFDPEAVRVEWAR